MASAAGAVLLALTAFARPGALKSPCSLVARDLVPRPLDSSVHTPTAPGLAADHNGQTSMKGLN
jgi:hypothetical protein